jgi:DNA-binding NarL/FixJ family response regulator
MKPVRTLLAQKSSVLRGQLAAFLARAGITDLTVASSFPELLEKAASCRPHLILLDICLVGDEFPRLLKELRQEMQQVKVVLLGPEPEPLYARHTAAMGIDLYLSDGLKPDEWIRRLERMTRE